MSICTHTDNVTGRICEGCDKQLEELEAKVEAAKEFCKFVMDNLNNEERFGLDAVRTGVFERADEVLTKLGGW